MVTGVDAREQLLARLATNGEQIRALERQHAQIVAAAQGANGDDEHDPEGATIGFERQQVAALLAQAVQTRAQISLGLERLEGGRYGTCEVCLGPIAVERLEARPTANTCIRCAARSR